MSPRQRSPRLSRILERLKERKRAAKKAATKAARSQDNAAEQPREVVKQPAPPADAQD